MVEKTETEEPKTLNNARISTLKNYKAFHSLEQVKGDLWKGKALLEAIDNPRMAKENAAACERDWIFFSRHYDDSYEWDKAYPEVEVPEELFGLKVYMIPTEKILFAYQPPTEGIILPVPGSILSGRSHQ